MDNASRLHLGRLLPRTSLARCLVFAVVLSAALIGSVCEPWSALLVTALGTFVVTATGWANHVIAGAVSGRASIAQFVSGSARDILLISLFMIPVAIVLPGFGCYTNRIYAGEALLKLSDAKREIAQRVEMLGAVQGAGEGVLATASGRLAAVFVGRDGTLIGAAENPPIVFVLVPALENGKVKWKCSAFPKVDAPSQCR